VDFFFAAGFFAAVEVVFFATPLEEDGV